MKTFFLGLVFLVSAVSSLMAAEDWNLGQRPGSGTISEPTYNYCHCVCQGRVWALESQPVPWGYAPRYEWRQQPVALAQFIDLGNGSYTHTFHRIAGYHLTEKACGSIVGSCSGYNLTRWPEKTYVPQGSLIECKSGDNRLF